MIGIQAVGSPINTSVELRYLQAAIGLLLRASKGPNPPEVAAAPQQATETAASCSKITPVESDKSEQDTAPAAMADKQASFSAE